MVDVIYFDLSKVFDTVDHAILSGKPAELSTPYAFHNTVINFVIGRSYQLEWCGITTTDEFTSNQLGPTRLTLWVAPLFVDK